MFLTCREHVTAPFGSHVCHLCVYPQERRREFEANLEKAGLELETDDKTVRNTSTEHQHHLVDSFLRHTIVHRKSLKGMAHSTATLR